MRTRNLAISMSIGAVALLGLVPGAGAAAPGFTVPATTIEAGTTLQITLTDECRNALGENDYGNLIQGGPISDNQETFGTGWIKGDTGVFRFPLPGRYKLGRWCDGQGYFGSVFITVVEASGPSTSTPATTSAPATSTPTTPTTVCTGSGSSSPGSTCCSGSGSSSPGSACCPGGTGGSTTDPACATTTTAPGATTTIPAVVEGRTSTRSGASTQAVGATPVAGSVSYTG